MVKLNYRTDIDGLRAFSILSVILYHAGFKLNGHEIFQGGLVGVDIFFVISGYLITQIILQKNISNKKFSIFNFYLKRVRRIVPLLYFIILISIPIAFIFLLPSSLVDFSKSAISSLIFLSNNYFHSTGLIYGAPDKLLKPLLHTWSLSIEAQFYIIFPIILILIKKFYNSGLFIFLILSSLISLITTQIIASKFPIYNFYFINVRIWEFLAGSIIAFLETKSKKVEINFYTNLMPLVGSVLILSSIFFLNDQISLPSFYSLPVVIGTCLIIYFLNHENLIFKILSFKFFVFIGLISYSLYLWHFPIFAFYNYIFFENENNLVKVFLIFLTFFISIFSYYFIEKPFRSQKIINNSKLFTIFSISFITILLICLNIIFDNKKNQKGLFQKVNIDNQVYVEEVIYKLIEIKQKNNFLQNIDSKKNILIIGNSHAGDTFLFFKMNENLFKNYNFDLFSFKFLTDKIFNKSNNDKNFSNFLEAFKKTDIILFSNRWSENDIKKLEDIIEPLLKFKKKIVILNQNLNLPSVGTRDVTLLDKFIINNNRLPSDDELIELEKKYFDYMINDSKRNRFNNQLMLIAKKYQLKLLDKSLYQCNYILKRCEIFTPDNEKINYNTHHHTLSGIKYLGNKIYNMNWMNIN